MAQSDEARANVFVSYCRSDVSADDARLRVFVEALRRAGDRSFDVAVDYDHPDARVGSDLQAYMRRIDTADVVVVVLHLAIACESLRRDQREYTPNSDGSTTGCCTPKARRRTTSSFC